MEAVDAIGIEEGIEVNGLVLPPLPFPSTAWLKRGTYDTSLLDAVSDNDDD